jgi:hypothetical protein
MSVVDCCGMPIVARQPGSPSSTVGRSGGASSTGRPAPSADLLPTDGTVTTASALAPHRALALDALHVLRTLRDRPRDAGPWGEPVFAREVDQVRAQLAPIRDRRGLAASFGREAFRTLDASERSERPAGIGAVRVAYAIRWLELGRGVRQPAWSSLVADRVADRA